MTTSETAYMSQLVTISFAIGCMAVIVSCSETSAQAAVQKKPVVIDFSHDVVPILRTHCMKCHGGQEAKGGFSINTRRTFLDGDMAVPGKPTESHFLDLIASNEPDSQMPPPKEKRVLKKDIETLKRWVTAGMPWQDGFTFAKDVYEPPLEPRRPKLPPIIDGRSNPIDRIVDNYWKQKKLTRPQPLSDAAFARRIYLDVIGLLPSEKELDEFLLDTSEDKRANLIDKLLNDRVRYAEHWLTFWNDLLRNDYGGTGFITGGRRQISKWLYQALVDNKPYNKMAKELIAPPTDESRGFIDGIRWRGEVSAGQTVEIQFAQSVGQSFLGINIKCASCHDSFIDRWTLKDSYGLAAIYSERTLEIHRCDKPTGEKASPAWLFPTIGQIDAKAERAARLAQLAQFMTSPKNGRFTRTIVNRIWFQLMGRGIVHPVDAMQTRPWNEDLLDYLAIHLQDNNYDLKQTIRLIVSSHVYQSQAEAMAGESDEYVFRGPRVKRMTAEQFVDNIWKLTGTAPNRIDAPVTRGHIDPAVVARYQPTAKWIWGDSAVNGVPAAGETLAFMHTFKLDGAIKTAGAIVTCDNEYELFINGKRAAKDTNWTTVESISLSKFLKPGENTILIRAKNGGGSPNPAGLYFEARITQSDGQTTTIISDAQWQYTDSLPKEKNPAKWDLKKMTWKQAAIVPTNPWENTVRQSASRKLAESALSIDLMPRASLMKSDFLMRSLGRPNRDQIVTSRPNELTTLEAIDLSNNTILSVALSSGSRQFVSEMGNTNENPDAVINRIFRSTLCRQPTAGELEAVRELFGEQPTAEEVADVLWAICMMPEFLLIR